MRKLARTPAALTVAGLMTTGLVLGAPAVATTSAGPAVDVAVEYVMGHDGVSEVEAKRRVAVQERMTPVADRLVAELGVDRTGGAYVDRATGDLVVTVLDDGGADAVRDAGLRPVRVRHSTAELLRTSDDVVRGYPAGAVTEYGIDTQANLVRVDVRDDLPGDPRAGVPAHGAPVAVRRVAGPAVATQAQFVAPGFTSTNATLNCTAGFTLRDALSSPVTYLSTAAHCTNTTTSTSIGGVAFGQRLHIDTAHDFAVVTNLNPAAFQQGPFVWGYQQGWKTVIGQFTPLQNAVVCKSGQITGYDCGTVTNANAATTTTINGVNWTVTEIIKTTICVRGGDSGGPMVTPSTDPTKVFATGITHGARLYNGSGQPSPSGTFCGTDLFPPQQPESYFERLSGNLARVGMSVMTG